MSEAPDSILVYVGGDRIGDALLKMPVIQGLRIAAPDAHICWLAGRNKSAFKGALKELIAGQLDEVIESANIGRDLSQLIKRPMPDRHFDLIIDSQNVLRTSLILKRIRHRRFISPAAGFLFSDKKPDPAKRPVSIREKLLQLFSLGLNKPVHAVYQLAIPEQARRAAKELLPEGETYIGFAPGAGGSRKRWPLERYLQLANQQNNKKRRPVFFIGPDEREWVERIRSEVRSALLPEVDNTSAYPESALLSIALAERLTAGVSNDAGGGHILAAGNRPLITLFGPTNSSKFSDESQNRIVIEARDFGGTEIERIPLHVVDEKIDQIVSGE